MSKCIENVVVLLLLGASHLRCVFGQRFAVHIDHQCATHYSIFFDHFKKKYLNLYMTPLIDAAFLNHQMAHTQHCLVVKTPIHPSKCDVMTRT